MPGMIPIFDGHNDTLLSFSQGARAGGNFFARSDTGHIDFPRAQAGGLAGGFFALYSPSPGAQMDEPTERGEAGYRFPLAPPRDHLPALQDALAMAALLFRWERASQGRLKVVRTAEELRACIETGVMAAVLHIEGAEAIDPELNALELLYQAGLRSLGPVWSRQNVFGSGVPFRFPHSPDTGDGLTPWGKALVRRCNELGILVDLSHITWRGFWEVAELSSAPLVATHSNAHALCPSPRNLTDEQLVAIRDSNGLVGLNFGVGFLRQDGLKVPDTPLEAMVRQIDYLVEKVGLERVGFGSDFDGTTVPAAIGDASGLPKLIEALRAAGYDEAALRQLGFENWLRVLGQTWR